jgi:hypothetical protein
MYVSFGMETLFYCALLMLAFWLWQQGHRPAAMVAAAALTWMRADGAVLGGTFWLVATWETWQTSHDDAWPARLGRLPWKLGIIYVACIAPWFVFAWAYFGTPLPNTLNAKQEIFQGVKFWVDGFGWWKAFYANNPLSLITIPFILLGIWRAFLRPSLRPVALWAIFFTAGYTILNVTAFWYYAPLVASLIILAALGGEWFGRLLMRYGVSRPVVLGVSLALVAWSVVLAVMAAWPYGSPPPRVGTYRMIGQWIEGNTPPDSTILVGDLGIMGYYAERRTLDTPGLVVPKLQHWQDGYTIARYRPHYIVATQYYAWVDLVGQDWFTYQYAPVAQLSTSGDIMSPITLYQRRFPLDVPVKAVQGSELPLTCLTDLAMGVMLPQETRARLLSSSGELLAEASHPFLWDQYPGTQATQAEELFEYISLPLVVAPGRYVWEMECATTNQGEIEVLPVEYAEGYTAVPDARWDGFAWLAGAAVSQEMPVWSGGMATVTLKWEAIETPSLDYSVFLHLRDASGQIVAQADGYPLSGSRPTTSWTAEEIVVDGWTIRIPPTVPSGDYQLLIGWYDWRSGERLALSDGRDAVELPGTVHIQWPGGSGLP